MRERVADATLFLLTDNYERTQSKKPAFAGFLLSQSREKLSTDEFVQLFSDVVTKILTTPKDTKLNLPMIQIQEIEPSIDICAFKRANVMPVCPSR